MTAGQRHILVVDDSAVVREALRSILTRAGFEVGVASDPIIAQAKMAAARPDALVLDLEMPRMDGLTFLRRIMESDPIPVLVCSGRVGPGSETALEALEQGAVGIVAKPRLGVKGFLEDSALQLVEAVRGAAEARPRPRVPRPGPRLTADALLPRRTPRKAGAAPGRLIAVGASTGGTEAVRLLLEAMPPDAPGIAVVQHMPEGFTAAFARRLAATCRIGVKEAADGDRLEPGRALVAPGNRHLTVRREGDRYVARILDGPPVSRHRPSADVLFRSAAQAAGAGAVGVILTGMGDDGAEGLLEMRRSGAFTLAQDEATSVVFGMPKEAIARGAVDEVHPLQRIARVLLDRLG